MTEKPRLLMAFRADEVNEGDVLALPFGPAIVTKVEREGLTMAITAEWVTTDPNAGNGENDRYDSSAQEWLRSDTWKPAPHEGVVLWEKR